MKPRTRAACALLALLLALPAALNAAKLWSETAELKPVEYANFYVLYFDGLPADDDPDVRTPFDSAMKLFDAQDFAGAVHQLDDAFPAANGVLEYAAIDNLTGWALFKQGLVDSALQSYRSSLKWALAAPDSDAIGAALSQIGIIYGGLTGPAAADSALEYLRDAQRIHYAIADGWAYANDCNFLEAEFAYVTHQPDSALWYGKMRLLAMLAVGNDTMIAGALANIGNDYRDLNQPGKALENFLEAWQRVPQDYLLKQDLAPLYRQMGREVFIAACKELEMSQTDIDALIARLEQQ